MMQHGKVINNLTGNKAKPAVKLTGGHLDQLKANWFELTLTIFRFKSTKYLIH